MNEKRSGDQIDSEMLFYLCDPDLFFITDDADLRERCHDSPQHSRIKLIFVLVAELRG